MPATSSEATSPMAVIWPAWVAQAIVSDMVASARFSAISRRRRFTRSASTPAGNDSRKIGKVVATCTEATASADGDSEVINQPEPTSRIQVPMLASSVAAHSTRKVLPRSGAQGETVGVVSDGPAGTAQGSPEATRVLHRRGAQADAVPVAVHCARAHTAAGGGRALHPCLQRCAFGLSPRSVAAKASHRRPIGQRRGRWLVVCSEIAGRVDDAATQHRQQRAGVGDLGFRAGEVVAVRHDQVGELALGYLPLLPFLVGEPGDVLGPHPQRGLAVEAVALRVELQAADASGR